MVGFGQVLCQQGQSTQVHLTGRYHIENDWKPAGRPSSSDPLECRSLRHPQDLNAIGEQRWLGSLEVELALIELSEVHEQSDQVGAVVVNELLHSRDELLVGQGFGNGGCTHDLLLICDYHGVLSDVRFEGNGCAISQASTSLMTAALKGKTVGEAQRLFESFRRLVTGEPADGDEEKLGKLGALAGVRQFPSRIKCATLAWHALYSALTEGEGEVSTESSAFATSGLRRDT